MPYIKQPPWARYAERAVITLAYALLIWFGIGIESIDTVSYMIALVQIVSGLTAIFGVLTGRYRWEWVSLSPLIASTLAASVLMSHGNGVLFVIIAAVMFTHRFIHLTAVAQTLSGKRE